jgi:hypothetical protein
MLVVIAEPLAVGLRREVGLSTFGGAALGFLQGQSRWEG